MTAFFRYRDAAGASDVFSVDLGNDVIRLGDIPGWTEMAEHCAVGSTTITLDDPDADVGYSDDAIRGLARLEVDETAMAAGNRRVYNGIFGVRTYSRRAGAADGSLRLGSEREIEAELHDLNALLSVRVIPQSDRDAIRPRETVTARMAWIVGSTYLSTVHDDGYIVDNATMMTKADYRGQRPVNVINDCELAAGFGWNAFVYWDEAQNHASLFFDNSNTSTAFTSTLRISNVLDDLDTVEAAEFLTGTTFAPDPDAKLRRDPADVGSGVFLPYTNGAVYRTRTATRNYYGPKDIIAPNSNVKSRDRATDQADDFLYQHKDEEDRITCTVDLPSNKVNLIKAGWRLEVKFSHFPGYEDWTWMRVLMRSPAQIHETDDRYTVALELSPQEANENACASLSRTPTGTYLPLGGPGPFATSNANESDGVSFYFHSGLTDPAYPFAGQIGDWHFPDYGSDGAGAPDYWGTNTTVFVEKLEGSLSSSGTFVSVTSGSPGDTFVVDLDPAADSDAGCVSWIHISQALESNSLYLCFVGKGTATIHTEFRADLGPSGRLGWSSVEWERT